MKTDYQIIRESKGYSLKEFAEFYDLCARWLYYIEKGEREPSKPAKAFYKLVRKGNQ